MIERAWMTAAVENRCDNVKNMAKAVAGYKVRVPSASTAVRPK